MQKVTLSELDSGERIISERVASVRSVSLGFWIDVGSRDESPDQHHAGPRERNRHPNRPYQRALADEADRFETLCPSDEPQCAPHSRA